MTEPSVYVVHGALIASQVIFGGGSVVGKLGVSTFNPMVFALIREGVAGVLLVGIALACDGRQQLQKSSDIILFIFCGVTIFTNQACFILGDKIVGAVIASAWQPSQPVFSLVIAVILGWERLTVGKGIGIVISFGGAAFMALYGATIESSSLGNMIAGNALLFCNCLGTALYVICCKIVISRGYPPVTVTAWSYLVGASMMLVVATCMSSSCRVVNFLCPNDPNHETHTCGEYTTSCDAWAVPRNAVLPLVYWILLNSCVAYMALTWANKYCNAGFVLAYCALQPLTACVVSVAIISIDGSQKDLSMPGWNALGGIPIFLGLALILRDGTKQHGQPNARHSRLKRDDDSPNGGERA
eukprot:TRINITY_DN3892_c0_g3_i1.p1 TRINITY_DN3892_c0_g3~~TRINITY_DN3892_c0_g3_i1.p1  ORF type:complete len:357 (-),score=47.10 TRINITY_DN3892_c0_g3_i1:87-1157(-)